MNAKHINWSSRAWNGLNCYSGVWFPQMPSNSFQTWCHFSSHFFSYLEIQSACSLTSFSLASHCQGGDGGFQGAVPQCLVCYSSERSSSIQAAIGTTTRAIGSMCPVLTGAWVPHFLAVQMLNVFQKDFSLGAICQVKGSRTRGIRIPIYQMQLGWPRLRINELFHTFPVIHLQVWSNTCLSMGLGQSACPEECTGPLEGKWGNRSPCVTDLHFWWTHITSAGLGAGV